MFRMFATNYVDLYFTKLFFPYDNLENTTKQFLVAIFFIA